MENWLFAPPVTFLLIFVFLVSLSRILSHIAYKNKKGKEPSSTKAYACGEDTVEHRVQVDYSQFFAFAFFFTVLHVLALMVATVPAGTMDSFFIAVLYIVGAITGLAILFRR